jgi:hypothetical protein
MKRVVVIALSMLLGQGALSIASAASATASGSAALALAAVVAGYSPSLSAPDRSVIARLFDGQLNFAFPATQKISIKADAVVCQVSDVDITARSCKLIFGTHKRTLNGRRANELNATAAQADVPTEGAAGTIFTSFSHLACIIDPNEIKQKAGGGANCTFDTE